MRAALAAALTTALAPAVAHAQDVTVTSFDGTPIVAHVFPAPGASATAPAPTILNGPGWAGMGDTDPNVGLIKQFNSLGYNVVTWSPRGFGASGGLVSIDSLEYEGPDTSKLIDYVAAQPWAQLDGAGDPRIGMAGGSYGGGIQYTTAIKDHRLDALVPVVGWHSLTTALYKDKTFKQGWDQLLYASGVASADSTPPGLDPHITSAFNAGMKTGVLSTEDEAWFATRGPGDAVKQITAPTMVVGGTVDTLFPLDEDIKLYETIKRGGAPVKMVWFCGGHGECLTGTGDPGQKKATLSLGSQLGGGLAGQGGQGRRRHRQGHAEARQGLRVGRGDEGHPGQGEPGAAGEGQGHAVRAAGRRAARDARLLRQGLGRRHHQGVRADRRRQAQARGRQPGHADPADPRRQEAHRDARADADRRRGGQGHALHAADHLQLEGLGAAARDRHGEGRAGQARAADGRRLTLDEYW
jgi:pimeloyl-ACP methyl ester carboxylesterase